jgi:hypothetical protein
MYTVLAPMSRTNQNTVGLDQNTVNFDRPDNSVTVKYAEEFYDTPPPFKNFRS